MPTRRELMSQVSDLLGEIDAAEDAGVSSTLLEDAAAMLDTVRGALWQDDVDHGDADAGDTALPHREGITPVPDPSGAWLLIMHDRHAPGMMFMRRYGTKEDAMSIHMNYGSAEQVWLYEVKGEVDLAEAAHAWSEFVTDPPV